MIDIQKIHQTLVEGPHAIEKTANDVVEKKSLLDEAKRKLAKAEAVATFSNKDSAKNQAILAAIVTLDPEVDKEGAALVLAQKEYLLAVARHERARDNFDAVRKQANLLETSIRSGIHG